MSVLVIIYSHTGTSRQVAIALAQLKGWDVGEIVETGLATHPRSDWTCILDSVFRRRPAILYQGPKPERFDAVVLVSPVWMHRLAGPMRTFLAEQRQTLPPVGMVSVLGAIGAEKAAMEVAHLLHRMPMLTTAVKRRDVEQGTVTARLQAFADAVERSLTAEGPLRSHIWSPSTA